MSVRDKLLKNSTIKETALLNESKIYGKKDMLTTQVPLINTALSGSVDGGLTSGLLILAGPSKHFKTAFALLMASAFIKKYPDGAVLFYDDEFGTPASYVESFDLPADAIVHTPITDIEQLRHDIMVQLKGLDRKDKVLILVDSIGNLASKKEVDDAEAGKTVADMTRAKQLKSLFRMITPHLSIKDIPAVMIAHTYATQEMYSKQIVSGGCLVLDTEIVMSDGSFKAIQNIQPGDRVYTVDGPKDVLHNWDPETLEVGERDCVRLTFEDGSVVECSEDHPFFIEGQVIYANELQVGDDLETA